MNAEAEVTNMLVGHTIKYTYEGAEIILKLMGKGAKELAILLAALLKDEKKWAGATHLKRLSKETRSLRVIQIPQDKFAAFSQEAKAHGILFSALREKKKNGICDVFIKTEDVALINRVLERTGVPCVELATIETTVNRDPKSIDPTTPEAGNLSETASGASMDGPSIDRPPSVLTELEEVKDQKGKEKSRQDRARRSGPPSTRSQDNSSKRPPKASRGKERP